jgi:peptide/nickel transport system permease protein
MTYKRYIAKKTIEFVISMVILSFVVFSLLYLAPGDPVKSIVGVKNVPEEVINAIRDKYHLNDPFLVQYKTWVSSALHFDFGDSVLSGEPVLEKVKPYAKSSIYLILVTFVLSLTAGLGLGIVSGKNKGRKIDKVINFITIFFASTPSFVVGMLLLYFFGLTLGLFPIYGLGEGGFLDTVYHLTLPGITLMLGLTALVIQITRVKISKEEQKDYVAFKRTRGISERKITLSELKNSSGPILTSTGLLVASVIGSIILVETVYGIPGLGSLLANSVTNKDIPVVQFLTLALAFVICFVSAAIDIIVYKIDPQSAEDAK